MVTTWRVKAAMSARWMGEISWSPLIFSSTLRSNVSIPNEGKKDKDNNSPFARVVTTLIRCTRNSRGGETVCCRPGVLIYNPPQMQKGHNVSGSSLNHKCR